jgi:hypothetical protein
MKTTETYTIVAAQPEWFLAIFDNTNGVRYKQIIAWEVRRTTSRNGLVTRSPIPITAEGDNNDLVCTDWAIKRPDGKFVIHSNDMSEELLSRIAPLTEVESPSVGSPSIADDNPTMGPLPAVDFAFDEARPAPASVLIRRLGDLRNAGAI